MTLCNTRDVYASESSYKMHRRRLEDACPQCKRAHADYRQKIRDRRRALTGSDR